MAANELNALLRAGIEAARGGNRTEARQLLRQVLERDPRNESAWFWLASVSESLRERGMCLERVVQINPKNQRAVEELAKVRATLTQQKNEPAPSAVAPPPDPAPVPIQRVERPAEPARPPVVAKPAAPLPPLKTSTRRGFFSTPSGILLTLFAIVGGIGIVVALITLPGLLQPPPAGTRAPTSTDRPTLSFIAQQQTLDAARVTVIPTATYYVSAPSPVPLVAATWTPIPSDTPLPSATPTQTPIPLTNLSLVYSGEGRGRANIGIYIARADGQGTEKLLVNREERSFDVAVSRDGKQIAFITISDGKEQLAIADANGGSVRVITKFTGKFTRTPAWSPDGKNLVVVSNQTSNDELYLVAADGSNTTRLTNGKINNRDPGWSPDGKRVIFASDISGHGSYQIFTIDPDGKNPKQLTESQNSNISPSFSPDGRQIVFISSRGRKADIYLMTADGEDEQLILMDDGNAENRDPSFSPDSRWIAFSSTRDGVYNVFVISIDGTQVQQITKQKNVSIGPRFMPTP